MFALLPEQDIPQRNIENINFVLFSKQIRLARL